MDIYNPEIKVEPATWEGKTFHVIREDYLPGGTKQRALFEFINRRKEEEFVYAGPTSGYAHCALSYVTKLLNKKATVFLQTGAPHRDEHAPLVQYTRSNGANIHLLAKTLDDTTKDATNYVENVNKGKETPTCFMCPFGLDSEEYKEILRNALISAMPQELKDSPPKRLWITVGSGTLLRVIATIWTETVFMPVRVGKGVWEDQYDPQVWKRMGDGLTIEDLKAPQRFFEKVARELLPPYSSVSNYDAKVWQFVQKHGKDGDYIWNVGRDKTDEDIPPAFRSNAVVFDPSNRDQRYGNNRREERISNYNRSNYDRRSNGYNGRRREGNDRNHYEERRNTGDRSRESDRQPRGRYYD